MVFNNTCPKIEVNPETYEVKADGKLITCEPATFYQWHKDILCIKSWKFVIQFYIIQALLMKILLNFLMMRDF